MPTDVHATRQRSNVFRPPVTWQRSQWWYVALMVFLTLGIQGCAETEGEESVGATGLQATSDAVQTTDGTVDDDAPPTGADASEGEAEGPGADDQAVGSSQAGGDDASATSDSGAQASGPMGRMRMRHHGDEDAYHRRMLDEALQRGLIDQADADLFFTVHDAMDPYRPAGGDMGYEMSDEGRRGMQRAVLASAVEDGAVDPADAERFTEIHDLLIDEGLMR